MRWRGDGAGEGERYRGRGEEGTLDHFFVLTRTTIPPDSVREEGERKPNLQGTVCGWPEGSMSRMPKLHSISLYLLDILLFQWSIRPSMLKRVLLLLTRGRFSCICLCPKNKNPIPFFVRSCLFDYPIFTFSSSLCSSSWFFLLGITTIGLGITTSWSWASGGRVILIFFFYLLTYLCSRGSLKPGTPGFSHLPKSSAVSNMIVYRATYYYHHHHHHYHHHQPLPNNIMGWKRETIE